MTDAQFGALLTAVIAGLGSIVGMIRWGVTRVTKAMDDQSSSNLRLADAQIELAASAAAQRADIDHITRWIYTHTPGATPQPTERERTPVRSMPVLTQNGLRAFGGYDHDEPSEQRPGSRRRSEAGPRRTTAVRGVPTQQDEDTPNYRGPFGPRPDDDR